MNNSNQTLIGVKVKPLVWHSKNQWHYYTDPEPGSTSNSQPMQYVIKHYNSDNGLWDLYGPGHWGPGNKFPTLEAAQAAAQANYEARILAALEVTLPPDVADLASVTAQIMEEQQYMDIGVTEAQWQGLYEVDPSPANALPPDVAGVVEEAGKVLERLAPYGKEGRGSNHPQSIACRDAENTIRALISIVTTQTAQIKGLETERDENAQDAYMMGKWKRDKEAAEAEAATLRAEKVEFMAVTDDRVEALTKELVLLGSLLAATEVKVEKLREELELRDRKETITDDEIALKDGLIEELQRELMYARAVLESKV